MCIQNNRNKMIDRDFKIDTLRGMACLLLVAFHVVGSEATNGLRISAGAYRDLNDILAYVRMPLFTFLSGFVYAYRPFQAGFQKFLIKKARRLLLPMLTVGTLFALLQTMTPGANSNIENLYYIHIVPVAHFWFIESLFLLFIVVCILEKLQSFASFKRYILVLIVSSVFYISPIDIKYFSVSGLLYLFPYFLVGMGIYRYKLLDKLSFSIILICLLLTIVFFVAIYMSAIPMYGKRTLPSLIVGGMSCVVLLSTGLKSSFLAYIGGFSYSIYIYHVFFTASSRIFLNNVGLSNLEVVFVVSLLFGVLGPIVVETILEKFNFSRVLFLGRSPVNSHSAPLVND